MTLVDYDDPEGIIASHAQTAKTNQVEQLTRTKLESASPAAAYKGQKEPPA